MDSCADINNASADRDVTRRLSTANNCLSDSDFRFEFHISELNPEDFRMRRENHMEVILNHSYPPELNFKKARKNRVCSANEYIAWLGRRGFPKKMFL